MKRMPPLSMHSNELFGGEAPPEIKKLIDQAKAAPRGQVSHKLWAVQRRAPDCLPVYYLLYKLHASRKELKEAEHAALLGLAHAGMQSGLPVDERGAIRETLPKVNFMENGPARFWLFTLKALAYIRVRSGRRDEARKLLECIRQCDPTQSVGSEVVLALLSAAAD